MEWSGVAIHQVLRAREQSINDLANLKANVESEITRLANQLKNKYSVERNAEVVFSFQFLSPGTERKIK